MRIAITATGTDVDSQVDPRFGRAQFILILEESGAIVEAVDNSQNLNAMRGAGIQAAKILSDKKVDVLMTGHCGPNAFTTLKAAGIKVGIEQSGTVKDALDRFNRKEVEFADQPNVEAHW
ncbi:MAG: NifB/NifX family molybdenum-iron cluster-binding protein [Desulfomonilaceae bacterium]